MMMRNRLAMNNTELMKKILRRGFVIDKRILPNEITNEMVVESASGEKLRFNIYGDNKVKVNIIEIDKCWKCDFARHSP